LSTPSNSPVPFPPSCADSNHPFDFHGLIFKASVLAPNLGKKPLANDALPGPSMVEAACRPAFFDSGNPLSTLLQIKFARNCKGGAFRAFDPAGNVSSRARPAPPPLCQKPAPSLWESLPDPPDDTKVRLTRFVIGSLGGPLKPVQHPNRHPPKTFLNPLQTFFSLFPDCLPNHLVFLRFRLPGTARVQGLFRFMGDGSVRLFFFFQAAMGLFGKFGHQRKGPDFSFATAPIG